MTSSMELLLGARALDCSDRRAEALSAYRAYLEAQPGHAEAWAELGGLLLVMGSIEEAEQACRRALDIAPCLASAMVNLAHALLRRGKVDEAGLLSRRVLAQDPLNGDAMLALADCRLEAGELDLAQVALERLMAVDPSHEMARARLNNLYIRQGNWGALRRDLERQLNGFSGAEEEYERSHLQLLFGEMPEGWAHFEARLRVPGRIRPQRSFQEPCWEGQPFPGQTLLVHFEQGFGDTLMFLRYLPLVKTLGGTVVLMVQPELADLAATCSGADRVVPEGAEPPPFDLQVSLMSLPALFRTCLETIPAGVPYLEVPERVPNRDRIREVLAAAGRGVRIGLVWAGTPLHRGDARRSLPVEELRALGALEGVLWFSLQLGRSEIPALNNLVPMAPLLHTFSDTAYALSGMDLVITVDTATVHLAGAMGIPTLLLLPFQPDFRWMLDRQDSPWYPSLRIYRQPVPGDWGAVLERVVEDLGADS